MYRRILSLLLLPCLLLNQSAAVFGHSHGGSEPVGHGLRAHIHVNSSCTCHCHHHHGNEHHHDHDEDVDGEANTQSEHDSDAIYISSVDGIVNTWSLTDCNVDVSYVSIIDVCSPETSKIAQSHRAAVNWANGPPLGGYSCPLYLRLLNLLI